MQNTVREKYPYGLMLCKVCIGSTLLYPIMPQELSIGQISLVNPIKIVENLNPDVRVSNISTDKYISCDTFLSDNVNPFF